MGLFSSKQWDEMLEVTKSAEEDEAVPDQLNNSDIAVIPFPMDPRSPTQEITRTPIQVENAEGKGKFTFSSEFDPRSPTTEVNRTPFMVKLSKEATKNYQNEEVKDTLILTEHPTEFCRRRGRKLHTEVDESLTENEDKTESPLPQETQHSTVKDEEKEELQKSDKEENS